MNKEFVPYKQALELKELGMDTPCFSSYGEDGKISREYHTRYRMTKLNSNEIEGTIAPLYQQAFRWFRENHDICSWVDKDKHGFSFMLYNRDYTTTIKDTYEEAELACLRKLIEIIKENE